jgi:23S rRNA (adenine2503-C2)-methyltransferase
MIKKSLCGHTAEEIFDLISSSGYTRAHALAISNSIYKKKTFEFSSIPGIPGKLKEELSEMAITGITRPAASEISSDSSIKYLFRSDDGKEYETVFIPEIKRHTVCVSTQSGCRMRCSFCATGRYGFNGNLTAGEIVNQLLSLPDSQKITHVVFMGMGEPMDNLDNVLKACNIITAEWGLALSPRNVTVSTVGITPAVNRFLKVSTCNLTLSLHTPFSAERERIVPVEKRYPVRAILDLMKGHPLKKKRRLSIAYIMISDFNDSDTHLAELILMLKNSGIRINLLPYHNTANNNFISSTEERIQFFKHCLVMSGISASIRKSRGADISAACGLLAAELKQQGQL